MPTWKVECGACGHSEEVSSAKCDPDPVTPDHCGRKMVIDFSAYRTGAEVFEAYETTHMHPDGKKLVVRNSADLKRYQREFGVYRVDDPNLKAVGGKLIRQSEPKGRTHVFMGNKG